LTKNGSRVEIFVVLRKRKRKEERGLRNAGEGGSLPLFGKNNFKHKRGHLNLTSARKELTTTYYQ